MSIITRGDLMPRPTTKSTAMNKLLSTIAGKDREYTIRASKCMTCSEPDMDFKDSLSVKEYTISGMCQRCQDEVFGEDV